MISTQSNLSTRSKPHLKIRRASWDDMPKIAKFIRSSADWYRDFVDEKDMGEHEVDESWMHKNYLRREFYVGRDSQDNDVGTISLQNIKGHTYLGYIYLDVNHVGKGFGHRLMKFAEQESRNRGREGMILIAHPEAKWATSAYKKFGFELIASNKKDVLKWHDGALDSYYEEGFQLYKYSF